MAASAAIFYLFSSQWKGSNATFLSFQLSFLLAYIINGTTTITIQPIASTEYQTVLLPVEICPGGTKLNTNASNDPQNPTPLTIHINPFPLFPIL